jgi:signal transduction histidine kinase
MRTRRSVFFLLDLTWMLALLLAWLPLSAVAYEGKDHITHRAWLEDASGQLSWPEVQQSTPLPYTGMLSKGFGSSVIWLRLRIDPQAGQVSLKDPDRLVLRIRPVYLDDIQVFDPLAPQGLVGRTGDIYNPRLDEFEGMDFLWPIARGTQPRDIWLRLDSTSTRQIDVQALSVETLDQRTRVQQLVFAVYIGLILIFAVWALVYWLFSRENLIGAFCLTQTTALFYALGSLGYMRAFWPIDWPPAWLDMGTTVFSISAVSTAVLFHLLLLKEFDPPRWILRLLTAMLALWPLKLLLLPLWPMAALRLNMSEVLISPFFFLLSVLLSRGWSQPGTQEKPPLGRPVVLAFYSLLVATLAMAALAGLGFAKSGEIALHIVQMHGLVTAFFVLLMLQYRAHVLNKQRGEISLALERSQLQAQQERDTREEQEKLLTMLAHELKTPLATMHMRLDAAASGSQEIRKAIRDMDNVIERCLQTTQLGDRQLTAQMATSDVVSIVRDAVSCCKQPARVQMDLPQHLNAHTDKQLLFIVLSNLLENACKYAAKDTPIRVRLRSMPAHDSTQPELQIEVTNAPGIAGWPEADKVFEKYYRSAHARRQAGTGLGLFLVRNLVQILGGRIDYAPDDSTIRFVVQLPVTAKSP